MNTTNGHTTGESGSLNFHFEGDPKKSAEEISGSLFTRARKILSIYTRARLDFRPSRVYPRYYIYWEEIHMADSTEDFYILGFEQDAKDGKVVKTMEGAAPLRFILGTLAELKDDAREAEAIYGAPLKLYRLVEVGNVLPTEQELIA